MGKRNNGNGLTDQQEKFCNEYLIDYNGTQAAIRSGYAKTNAEVQASRLLSKAKISDRIREISLKAQEETKITPAWVLRKAAESHTRAVNNGDERAVLSALQLIGKHIDVSAFEERAVLDTKVTYIVETGTSSRPPCGIESLSSHEDD